MANGSHHGTAAVMLNHRCNEAAVMHRAPPRTPRLSLRRRVTDLKAFEKNAVTLFENRLRFDAIRKNAALLMDGSMRRLSRAARRVAPQGTLRTIDSVSEQSPFASGASASPKDGGGRSDPAEAVRPPPSRIGIADVRCANWASGLRDCVVSSRRSSRSTNLERA